MTPELKSLLEYIAENMECEPLSGFMPYGPIWNIQAVPLLKKIESIYGVSSNQVGEVINPVRERIESQREI